MMIRAKHCMTTINNQVIVYNWGGDQNDMPRIHRSPLKDSLTSTVEVFDMESLSWNSVATTGVSVTAAGGTPLVYLQQQ